MTLSLVDTQNERNTICESTSLALADVGGVWLILEVAGVLLSIRGGG